VRIAAVWWPLVLVATPLPAQSDSARVGFVQAVRDATRRYAERATAANDGYRKIGPDFPSMGEHWISVPLVVSGTVDLLHPPILEYATLGGHPTLVGVAYAQLVRDGPPTTLLPAGPEAWHYHAGTVDVESFILGHAQAPTPPPGAGPRIAVLHAWVWLENPAGLFATNNWALPYARLGLAAPARDAEPSEATLAAALASGGESYLSTLIRMRHRPSSADSARIDSILTSHAAAIRNTLARGDDPSRGLQLTTAWQTLRAALDTACACGWATLGDLAAAKHSHQ